MITRSVTIEDIDELYLTWNDHINASALYRRALREEMDVRDVDPDELRDHLNRAREQGYTMEEIADETNRYADLEALVTDAQTQSVVSVSRASTPMVHAAPPPKPPHLP